MKKTTLVLATCVATCLLWSCKKSTTPNQPTASTPTVNTPADAFGAFVAVKTITEQVIPVIGTQIIEIGTAVGGFYSAAGSSTLVDGGTLTVMDSSLTRQSNNSYLFTPSQSNIQGLNFTSSTRWAIGGNTANSVPAFTYTHNANMPDLGTLTSAKEIQTSSDYTVSVSKAFYADSVIFIISGPNASIRKTKPTNTTSCLFTAAELGTLGKGDKAGLIQVAPYSVRTTTMSGKNYYFIKETVLSTFVDLK